MAINLTLRQRDVLIFLIDHIEKYGYAPSYREIMAEFSIGTPHGAKSHLIALEKKGYIALAEHKHRAIQILREV